ncbi:MAG TPA: GNAT family protein [Actinomycetota bacterium]|nr:GNAT family protein [Actinomycetota bacterium]
MRSPILDVKPAPVGAVGLPVRLPDGTAILLRPIVPSDRTRLHRGMAALSATARRHRFFTAKDALAEDLVTYLTEIDYQSHFAWVAVDVEREGQPVVAVGRYVTLDGALAADARDGFPGSSKVAEIAFVVGDDYQRQGLATILLDLLSIVAAANGIKQFFARVLDDNLAMRHVLTKAGGKLRLEDAGVLRATMDVPAPTARFSADEVLAIARSAAREGNLPGRPCVSPDG